MKVVSSPYLSYAPFSIAEEEGYFSEQGLQIEFIKMIDASKTIPFLIKGNLDVMADMILPSQLNAIARGAGIKIVADKGYLASTGCTYMALMARRTLIEKKEARAPFPIKGPTNGVQISTSIVFMRYHLCHFLRLNKASLLSRNILSLWL